MAPGLPTPVAANIHTLLHAVRSEVFLTTYNPTGQRLGNKYLKKSLKGAAMLQYYPKPLPRPRTLNHQVPSPDSKLSVQFPTMEWIERQKSKKLEKQAESSSADKGEVTASNGETSSQSDGEKRRQAKETSSALKKLSEMQPGESNLWAGTREVGRIPGSGLFFDAEEERRLQKVEKRRIIGKGAPKKGKYGSADRAKFELIVRLSGQGKRSQMKKR